MARVQLPAVILGSHANALTFARSLGRRGVPVWLLDSENALGRYTRYARVVTLPEVEQAPGKWLDTLLGLGERLGAGVLFSTTDAHCLWLAEHQEPLRRHFRFLSPAPAEVRRIVYKDRQYAAARAAHIPAPYTILPESATALDQIAARVNYPCLLKPQVAHRGRRHLDGAKVVVAHSPAELSAAYRRYASDALPFVVQEIVPGSDEAFYLYSALWDETGTEQAYLTFHKLRQYPAHFGTGSYFETMAEPRVVSHARRLLRELEYVGLAEVEFKYDAGSDEFFLIEMNPRAGTTSGVASAAGLDLGWLTHRYLSDGTRVQDATFRHGVRVMDEEMDTLALAARLRAGELSWWDWVRDWHSAKPIIAAWDDPLPMAAGIVRAGKRILQP